MAKKQALLCSTRLNLALVAFLGTVMFYALRSNLSFAIVCMVKPSIVDTYANESLSSSETNCNQSGSFIDSFTSSGGSSEPIKGEFNWSKDTQGTILSAFFWGYLTSQVLAGYLASRFGAKVVILAAVGLSSITTVVSPLAARFDVWLFIVVRILLGFSQGALFPAMSQLWASWAPPMERGFLTGISYAGAQIGNVVVMPLSAYLCNNGFDGGWPSIFYVLGASGVGWCILWWYFAADTPQKDRKISESERDYIMDSLGDSADVDTPKVTGAPPLRAILTSPAVWACFIGHFAGDWGAYSLATCLPTFMKDVLGLNLTSMGLISSIPYIAYFIVINVSGYIADQLQSSGMLSTLNTRRSAMLIALGGQALFLNLIGYCECGQELLVILFLILGIGISGFQYSGFVVNYLDICPAYAGTVVGIGNTLTCLAGILSPKCMGWLAPNGTKEEWRQVFLLTGVILAFGAAFFVVFARAEVQPWAKPQRETKNVAEIPLIEKGADPLIKKELD